jgi:Tannase and feruloyl esterase
MGAAALEQHRTTPVPFRTGRAACALLLGLVLTGSLLPGVAAAEPTDLVATPPVMDCQALAAAHFTNTPDAPARVLPSSITAAAGDLPEFCDVTGYVVPRVQFELRLPTQNWNGKYFQAGCGGFCGSIGISACNDALSRNYAVAANNSGQVGGVVDGLWAYDNRQAQIDWGNRSEHVVALTAKKVVARYYGQAPRLAYYQGCSTGGRQALMEAQRYPTDFDGIIAGAPANRQNYLAPIAQSYVERVNRDASHRIILPVDKLPLLDTAVCAACADADGLIDGPGTCSFDPGNGHEVYLGELPKGSKLGWGQGHLASGTDSSLSVDAMGSQAATQAWLRLFLLPGVYHWRRAGL